MPMRILLDNGIVSHSELGINDPDLVPMEGGRFCHLYELEG